MSLIFTSIMFVFSVNDRSVKSLFSKSFVQYKTIVLDKIFWKNCLFSKKTNRFFHVHWNDFYRCFFISLNDPSHSSIVRVLLEDTIIHKINSFILKISFVQTNDTHLYCMVRIASCSGTIFSSHLKKINIFEMP